MCGTHIADYPAASRGFVATLTQALRRQALSGMSPNQVARPFADDVQPSGLARLMAVMALFDLADPALPGLRPAAAIQWGSKPERWERFRVRWMLKHAAIELHGTERCVKASIIVTGDLILLLHRSLGKPSPALTRRMRHNRIRACIQPGVTRLVPRIDVRQSEVAAASFNK